MDISMPELDGVQTVERLLKLDPTIKVVMLSMYPDRILAQRAMAAGAADEIVRAIREAHGGGYYLSAKISGYFVEEYIHGKREAGEERELLTERQREVLKLICDGLTEKEIARILNIVFMNHY